MPLPLLITKLYLPPFRLNAVRRPRLVERLNAGLDRKLTLVSAAAGFGKTTLLSEWIAALQASPPPAGEGPGVRVAWLSLDEGDSDPVRFLTYLIAALQTAAPGVGDGVLAALQSPQPPPLETLLTGLINQLGELQEPLILFLDDYHVIETLATHQVVGFLIEHQPTTLHLVLASRTDPPFPLARLRARNQLTELRAADLRFAAGEAAIFLNESMGLHLTEADVAALEARTEGWIAGLQLAALSLRGKDDAASASLITSFGGMHHFVLDYLAEEVFQQQTDGVQSFLLQTAILDCLSGPLCDAVTQPGSESPDGQTMLEQLVEANLFLLPLDEERRWFRYHRLFADLLRQRLGRTSAIDIPGLHRRAAGWLAANGLSDDAFEHWLAAGAYDEAAQLAELSGFEMLEQGQLAGLLGWLRRLPDGVIVARPWLVIYHAWALLLSGQAGAVEPRLQAVEQFLAGHDPVDPALAGNVQAMRAYMAAQQGTLLQAARLAHAALATLPPEAASVRSIVAFTLGGINYLEGNFAGAAQAFAEAATMGSRAGNLHVAAPALRALGNLQVAQGRLHQAADTYRQALRLAETPQGRTLPLAAGSLIGLGDLSYEWNDLPAAEGQLRDGLALSRQWGNNDSAVHGLLSLAQVEQAHGDLEAAQRLLEDGQQLAQQHTLDLTVASRLAALRVNLFLAQGNVAAALDELHAGGLSPDSPADLLRVAELSALARALLASGRAEQARAVLSRLLHAAGQSGLHGDAVRLLALSSLARQAEGDSRQALADLIDAMRLAQSSAMVRSFVDLGEPLADLLLQIPADSNVASYASRLLDAFSASQPMIPPQTAPTPEQPLVEPLSQRELEVLALIAQGLSNRQIADELVISIGTVKAHTSNIYGKLGVNSRTQAIVTARNLGIMGQSTADG